MLHVTFCPASTMAINGNIFTFSFIKKETRQLLSAIERFLWDNLVCKIEKSQFEIKPHSYVY